MIKKLKEDIQANVKEICRYKQFLKCMPDDGNRKFFEECINDAYDEIVHHQLYQMMYQDILKKTEIYLLKNNLKSMVLGISGGLDSTVAAFICREISKRNPDIQFVAVSLPSKTNGTDENDIAFKVIETLADVKITHSIEDVYDSFNAMLNADKSANSIQLGNIKARIRMISLYHYASLYNGVVIDTDNLTEHYLGFYTIHGDVGDLAPISELWKTEVYNLASYLRFNVAETEEEKEILDKAIEIKPTDGNGLGCDMDQIAPGYGYHEVDAVLQWLTDPDDMRLDIEIADEYFGGDVEMVSRIRNRSVSTAFKRRPHPYRVKLVE